MDLSFVESKCVKDENGCWLWQGALSPQGYAVFKENSRIKKVSREVFKIKNGHYPTMACHECGVRKCVNPDHIYNGDAKSNRQDMLPPPKPKRSIRNLSGDGNPQYEGKMTSEIVLELRRSSEPTRAAAARLGVSPKYVRLIRQHKKWKHIGR